ncbi:hypothetical protein LguiB_027352 [Lonicera macranthoides]
MVSYNKLNGSFPKCFGQSCPLEFLDVSENELNGSLPDLTSFPLLRRLYLTNNKIQGRLPESIGELSNLKRLDLSFNLLTLELSSDWTPHFHLDHIILVNCKLGPRFPEWLRSQSNFFSLDISNARILDTIPHWFWDLSPRLDYLNISNNQIHGMLPDLSLKFVKLDQIDLGSNCFKGPIPLFPLYDLSQNKISANIPRCFNKLHSLIQTESSRTTVFIRILGVYKENGVYVPSALVQWKGKVSRYKSIMGLLKCIDLSSNKLDKKIPQEFASLKGLISMNLSRNNLTRPAIQNIGQMKMLEVLDFSRNQLSGVIPIGLGNLNSLSVLDLSSNNFLGKIPRSTQLDTFNVCGLPMPLCLEDESTPFPPPNDHGKAEDTFLTTGST